MDDYSTDKKLLHAHRILMRAGLSLISAFAWVFIFEYVFTFSHSYQTSFYVTLIVYALSQAVLLLATPLSAAHLRHGMKRSLIFGACLAALSFAVLGGTLAGYFSDPIGWGIVLFGLLMGGYRALYWIPYRLQTAGLGATQSGLFELLIALLPAFAGVTLSILLLSALHLLFGAAALLALSIVPIFFIRDFSERFAWDYAETFNKFFEQKYRPLALRAAFSGVESAALFVIWPLSVFLIVGGSYLVFGFVMTASLLILLVARSIYKRLMRSGFSVGSMPLDVAFSMSGWIFRLVAGSPIAVVFADSYSYVSAPAGSAEFASREHASDAGSYLDEYTALQEMSMAFGRIAMCFATGLLLILLPIALALAGAIIIAAFAAGFSTALSYKTKLRAY
jgi:hypothetical protein